MAEEALEEDQIELVFCVPGSAGYDSDHMTRNAKGCLMMAMPPIVLLGILLVWGIISFVAKSLLSGDAAVTGTAVTALRLVNVGLGFIGILCVLAVPVFVVIGLIYILTAPKPVMPPESPQQPPMPPSDINMQTPATP